MPDVTTVVNVPLWAAAITAGLAAIALLDRLLLPGVRYVLRRRARAAIERLNANLKLRIRPFKLTRRRALIDTLMADPEVQAGIEAAQRETGESHDAAVRRARGYAREITPAFSAYLYFKVGTRLARRVARLFYRVRVRSLDDAALEGIGPDASVVFVINHRSNMDYVLVTFTTAQASALSYAVGEWANLPLLRGLFRSMGAYFIRRNSSDPLYRRVLSRYVHLATTSGVVQAVFPEGGLTRDGALRAPKLGLISYMVQGFDPRGSRDIVFVPVGVNYDRVLEDRTMIAAANGTPDFRARPGRLAYGIVKGLWLGLRGRWIRLGTAAVVFGRPISLSAWLARRGVDLRVLAGEQREAEIRALGADLMAGVAAAIPALPVSLVATALLDAGAAPQTLFEVKGRVFDLMQRVEKAGGLVIVPRHDQDAAVEAGLKQLAIRHVVVIDGQGVRAKTGEEAVLRYYAHAIAHHLGGPAGRSDMAA